MRTIARYLLWGAVIVLAVDCILIKYPSADLGAVGDTLATANMFVILYMGALVLVLLSGRGNQPSRSEG